MEFVQILCLPWEPMCRDEFHDPCICHFLSEVERIPRAGVNCGWSMAD